MTSRRDFIGGAAASFFIGGCCSSKFGGRRIGPNEKVNVAIIGCGCIAKGTNVPGFLKDPRCRIVVACDMVKIAPNYYYGAKGSGFGTAGFAKPDGSFRSDVCGSTVIKSIVDGKYGTKDCREVVDWREVIADPTIDAVAVCTPDHWHAIISIAAMKAGKHVFCQKPMSLSIREGQAMARVARETGVVFQVGNQCRNDVNYRLPEELIFNGYLGKIKSATVAIPGGNHWTGHGYSADRAPLPDYFTKETWDLWQGPAAHFENDAYIPSIHEPTCWRFNSRYGNGMVTDFGAHEFDYLSRALGTDYSGPIGVENVTSDIRETQHPEIFSWANRYAFDFVYPNGLRVNVVNIDKDHPRQMVCHCEKGDVGIVNDKIFVPEAFKNFKESDFKPSDKLFYRNPNGYDGEYWHEADFVDGIIRGVQCCSPCEVGHRTISMAHLANAAIWLGVSKLGWDPAKEVFTGPYAAAAETLQVVKYNNGWSLGV